MGFVWTQLVWSRGFFVCWLIKYHNFLHCFVSLESIVYTKMYICNTYIHTYIHTYICNTYVGSSLEGQHRQQDSHLEAKPGEGLQHGHGGRRPGGPEPLDIQEHYPRNILSRKFVGQVRELHRRISGQTSKIFTQITYKTNINILCRKFAGHVRELHRRKYLVKHLKYSHK